MKQDKIENTIQDYDTLLCEHCGNVYRIDLVKESDDWNDFGYSYCPFCGDMTDDYAAMYEKFKERR